ncbi:MAG: hypothetical protein ABIJ96_13840 [Elusimicrobiota bacterium]
MRSMRMAGLAVSIFLAGALPAHAYLDPGSGSMYLQLLLGGLAGIGLVLKIFWGNILEMFGLGRKDDDGKAE